MSNKVNGLDTLILPNKSYCLGSKEVIVELFLILTSRALDVLVIPLPAASWSSTSINPGKVIVPCGKTLL